MAVPRSRAAAFAPTRRGDRLVARDLEFRPRINRTKSAGADRRRRLDHEEMVARDFHGVGENRLGRSVAAKFGSRISQHRPSARLVLQRHARQTRRRMEPKFSTGERAAGSTREHARIRARPRRRLFSRSTSTLRHQLGLRRARQPRLSGHGRPLRNLQHRNRQIPRQTASAVERGRPRMKRKRKKAPRRTPQQNLGALWEEHVRHEFATHNTEDTLATMVEDAYVNHIPVLTGGVGKEELREFYSKRFIPQMPPDTEMVPISRTIGEDQLVDEMIFKFTHTIRMDWMLPGAAPTGKRVEVPLVAIVQFRDGKLAHEHIYWDQASVLVQLGLLDAARLPVAGVETARKALDPKLPSNALMR